jgi:hypothetical protein
MLEPRTYSLVHYREAETVVDAWRELAREAERIQGLLPAEARDSFRQLVLHPVQASAVVNELYVTAGLNRLYAAQGRASANDLAQRARALFREDARLTREYNEAMSGGKWSHMMDQAHLGYTDWNQPPRNVMPAVHEVQVPEAAEMGVSIEGSEASWPGARVPAVLPALSVYERRPRAIEVFNRGQLPLDFEIETSAPWLEVDARRARVERDRRVSVTARWEEVPLGAESAALTVRGPGGSEVVVQVPIVNPPAPRPQTLHGFVEADGYVSIEAEHHSRAVAPAGREWKLLPDHGRTGSAMTPWPVTAPASSAADMRLEYDTHVFTAGEVTVHVSLSPAQKFQPGAGLRYGISFDNDPPQWISVHADPSLAAWERSVADGVTRLTSKHAIARPGAHVLKFWASDAGLVLQKLVVDAGGLRPSYLGPPESVRYPNEGAQP